MDKVEVLVNAIGWIVTIFLMITSIILALVLYIHQSFNERLARIQEKWQKELNDEFEERRKLRRFVIDSLAQKKGKKGNKRA